MVRPGAGRRGRPRGRGRPGESAAFRRAGSTRSTTNWPGTWAARPSPPNPAGCARPCATCTRPTPSSTASRTCPTTSGTPTPTKSPRHWSVRAKGRHKTRRDGYCEQRHRHRERDLTGVPATPLRRRGRPGRCRKAAAMADFVREIMTPGVVMVPPDASLVEAAQLMRAQGIGDVLVTSERHVLGVLTDRDITLRAVADGADPLTVSARAVCTPNPVVVHPGGRGRGGRRSDARARRAAAAGGRGRPARGHGEHRDIAIAQDPQSTLAQISRADGQRANLSPRLRSRPRPRPQRRPTTVPAHHQAPPDRAPPARHLPCTGGARQVCACPRRPSSRPGGRTPDGPAAPAVR